MAINAAYLSASASTNCAVSFSSPNETTHSRATGERLKQVMLLQEEDGLSIYGKTGMGKASGVTVDAWYTGFAETPEGNRYFCVWLGQTDGAEVTSVKAREIAVRMINDHWRME